MKRLCALIAACSGCATTTPALVPGVSAPDKPGKRSELVLHCTPTDAEVSLDGVPQGTCDDFDGDPRGLGLGRGSRRVEVKKRGFAPWESWMQADGTRVVMNVTLVPNGSTQ